VFEFESMKHGDDELAECIESGRPSLCSLLSVKGNSASLLPQALLGASVSPLVTAGGGDANGNIMSIYIALFTYSLEQSHCLEADIRPATQAIGRLFKNAMIHNHVRKNLPQATILIIKNVKLSLCLIN
jgi:hypothetical protein